MYTITCTTTAEKTPALLVWVTWGKAYAIAPPLALLFYSGVGRM